jgi:methyltransferase
VMGLVAVQRLSELAYSAWRLRADTARGIAKAIPEPGFLWMVAVHAGWFSGCLIEGGAFPAHRPTSVRVGAVVLWGGALLLRAWLMASLGRFWSVRLVARSGQPIVTAGPYRWVRHPNYLVVALEILAVPLVLGAVWTAVAASLANAWVLAIRIRSEEAYLLSVPGYQEAFGNRKRFLPGLF